MEKNEELIKRYQEEYKIVEKKLIELEIIKDYFDEQNKSKNNQTLILRQNFDFAIIKN